MNQELKEQARKEFDERFVKKPVDWRENHGWEVPYVNSRADNLKSFIDSLIDKTVQYERERIAKWVDKNTGPGGDTPYPELMCFIAEEKDFDVAIKSLITNKSDINK